MKFSGKVRVVVKGIGRARVQAPYSIVKGASTEGTVVGILKGKLVRVDVLAELVLLLLVLTVLVKDAADAVKVNHDNKTKINSFMCFCD